MKSVGVRQLKNRLSEYLREIDALHLASALTARSAVAGIEILSLDARVRNAAARLGFSLQPPELRASL